jgi:hypothetical protein
VPAGALASDGDLTRLRDSVTGGARAVVADQRALTVLGFSLGPPATADGVTVRGLAERAVWPAAAQVRALRAGATLEGFTPLARSGNDALVGTAALGNGRVLAVSADPLASGLQGHELFPTLTLEARDLLRAPTGPRRYGGEFYFDPGTLDLTPAQIGERFKDARAGYVAGWNYGYLDYPYAKVIDALHARGVRVYAWLEPPMVSLYLWNTHPECRERTQSGRDARVDWRSLIALEDARCFDLAWAIWNGLVHAYDWDGVNVAELYFEAANGRTDRMTPFHPSALRAFGGDPEHDLEGFFDWRTQEVTKLNRELVRRLRDADADLDIELTVIDDELDPEQGRQIGSDVKQLAAVARAYGASLQVEDPFTTWTFGPSRYPKLTPKVTPLLPPGRAFFDLNIVHRPAGRPTAQMTGAEVSLSVMNASAGPGRVGIYATDSFPDDAVDEIPFAVAGAATTGVDEVSAPWTVVVTSPRAGFGRLRVDGEPWPVAGDTAVIPGGDRKLEWTAGEDGLPALERIQAELTSQTADETSLRFGYTTAATAWTVVERRPSSISVDGKAADVRVVARPGGGFTLRLPAGDHDVALAYPAPAQ